MTPKRQSSKASSSEPVAQMSAGLAEEQPALNKDGSRRKSRVLRRKTDHSVIERRRREKINEKLVALQNLVPACRKECRDLIERKFAEAATSAPSAKRKREEEKLAKAQIEMQEKIKTSMVLEKLCIISHTLDFVNQLQEENEALRALCECQAQTKRRFSMTSDVEMDEHYRDAHNLEAPTATISNGKCQDGRAADYQKRECLSSPEPDLLPETASRNVRRRLHWGSDRVRESCSLTEGVCRHHEDQDVSHADDVSSQRCASTSSQCGSTSPPAASCKALHFRLGGEKGAAVFLGVVHLYVAILAAGHPSGPKTRVAEKKRRYPRLLPTSLRRRHLLWPAGVSLARHTVRHFRTDTFSLPYCIWVYPIAIPTIR